MKLARTLERVTLHPWLITPAGYAAVMRLVDSKLAGEVTQLPDTRELGAAPLQTQSNVAELTISGVLGQRLSLLERICGGMDYQDISQAIDAALGANVEGILFVFDSPGGTAVGCGECAAKIASIEVPTVAFTDSLMASGAYYLASGCDYIVATPSADVGSIGALIPWVDKQRLWDMTGLRFDPIYSEGDTLKPTMYGPSLSEEQRAYLQQSVNEVAAAFKTHVSSYRQLDFSALKAGAYSGQRALDFNLIDKVGLLQDARDELSRRIQETQAG
jgi:protease-4